jgi:ABC-type microcin C transport system permease subunit YejB
MAYWMSDVKNHLVVVLGAFIGAFLAFLIILGWVGTLIYDTVLPGANSGGTFFGSLFLCSVLGLSVAIISDLVVARMTRRDYRRSAAIAHE